MTKFYRDPAESIGRPEWMAQGACLDNAPELWFADTRNAIARAKEICAECPAVALCLQWAIDNREHDGVWGGRTAKERANLLRAAQYSAKQKASAA